jgi:nicotinamidase/pyrazinamidase
MKLEIGEHDALIVVDVQKDFCPGGALPVPEGDQVVPVLNSYIRLFKEAGAKIYATRDWHPPNHKSFKAYGGIWPPHCLKGSEGAEFHTDLILPKEVKVISKATKPSIQGYSGFDGTMLKRELNERGVKRIFVGGLATDYCVKSTVIDALKLGFETVLLTDATKGVNVKPDDAGRAIEEMVEKGAEKATLSDIIIQKRKFITNSKRISAFLP